MAKMQLVTSICHTMVAVWYISRTSGVSAIVINVVINRMQNLTALYCKRWMTSRSNCVRRLNEESVDSNVNVSNGGFPKLAARAEKQRRRCNSSKNLRGGGVHTNGNSSPDPWVQGNTMHNDNDEWRRSAEASENRNFGFSLHMYTMQPLDVGEHWLTASDRAGCLYNHNDLPLPDAISAELGSEFLSFRTTGDGGCGLHAACGFPNATRELESPSGQQAIRERIKALLPSSYATLKANLGQCEHLQFIAMSLWDELTVPAATQLENQESQIFWENLQQYQPDLAVSVLQFLKQKKINDAKKERVREHYRTACNAIFQLEYEASVIRPLALELASEEFPVDDSAKSRYMTLFAAHGVAEFDTRRRSFLEYTGKHSKRRLTQSLAMITQRLDP